MLRNAVGVGGVSFPEKKHYVGVQFNVIRRYEGGGDKLSAKSIT